MSAFQQFVALGHALVDIWERVYRVLKGLPHNRLASVVVGVGGVIISGPFWEPYFRAGAQKLFEVTIDAPPHPAWGALLIVVGLFYHLAMAWILQREKTSADNLKAEDSERVRRHDEPIFNRFLVEAPENKFKNALSRIADDHSYFSYDNELLLDAFYFLQSIGNKFNDVMVQEKASVLEKRLDELADFMALHFSVYGPTLSNDILRFCMEPQWNMDRSVYVSREDSRKYDELGRQLIDIVRATKVAYEELVRLGHQRLL
ncbi:hypothetical protein [Agrobacterium tumefaciens]|uniref:hypothetical protein n=1 Tax=Agrobacterium tumefaciens TaxID=358 RepID=UPI003B9EBCAC